MSLSYIIRGSHPNFSDNPTLARVLPAVALLQYQCHQSNVLGSLWCRLWSIITNEGYHNFQKDKHFIKQINYAHINLFHIHNKGYCFKIRTQFYEQYWPIRDRIKLPTASLATHSWDHGVWKAIWVFIHLLPISEIISRYREFELPISGNNFEFEFPNIVIIFWYRELDFPISGNNSRYPEIKHIFRYREMIFRYREISGVEVLTPFSLHHHELATVPPQSIHP